MTFKSSLLLAFRLIFPHFFKGIDKDSSAPKTSKVHNSRKNIFSAICCIGISIVPLIVVLVVSDGMINGMTKRIVELSSFHVQAIQLKAKKDPSENLAYLTQMAKEIERVQGVTEAYVERSGMVLVAGKEERSGATIRSVESKLLTQNNSFKELFTVHEGSLEFKSKKSAIIGNVLAEKIGVKVGDVLRVITMKNSASGAVLPQVSTFVVDGIISCGYHELDSLWVFVPLETGFSLLAANVSRIFIGINTTDAFSNDLYVAQRGIDNILNRDFAVYNWNNLNESQYANFRTSKILLLFIMFLIVLVASVNISSALIMLVMEHKKEIALLKSIGGSPKGITTAFVMVGFFMGLCGVALGIPVGFLCALNVNEILNWIEQILNLFARLIYNIKCLLPGFYGEFLPITLLNPEYYLTEFQVELPFIESLVIVFGTLLLSIIASIVPAIKAGKEKPLETLRKI